MPYLVSWQSRNSKEAGAEFKAQQIKIIKTDKLKRCLFAGRGMRLR